MASNDNNKRKQEEAEEWTLIVKKRLWHSDDDDNNDDSSGESEEEIEEEEVYSKESMNQSDTSEEKLMHKRTCGSDDGDTLTHQVSISRKSISWHFQKDFVASWCIILYYPKACIINLATWLIMLTCAIGPVWDKKSRVLFMNIFSTTSIVRCMNFCCCHI
jgi:hypothetical protein